jgi:alginate O-acetyltransferase complex protein AlgI
LLFNSIDFWIFFLVVCVAYFSLPHRWRVPLLLVASIVFYAWWNASYIVLLAMSSLIDFTVGLVLGRTRSERRRWLALAVSVTCNLTLLFVFKYWGFFHDSVEIASAWFGFVYVRPDIHVILPVGISFYTFQTISYAVDVYRRQLAPERSPMMFATFVLFFPQLVAGPIERAETLLRQFREKHPFDAARATSGLQLACWGLFKKVVIADRLAIYSDVVYGKVDLHNGLTLLFATYAFALQIYCDFSGYSDIAIGTARVLGIDLMRNFERPYFSTSIRDFWRRWHISLSTWLRDYLYIPLGGGRGSQRETYRNLMITMVLGGLWHGASWNFVIWGFLQGLMLSVSRATLDRRDAWLAGIGFPPLVRDVFRTVMVFHLVCFSWIFFRANTVGDAFTVVSRILGGAWGVPFVDVASITQASLGIVVLIGVEAYQEWGGNIRDAYARKPVVLRWAVWYALALMIVLLGVQTGSQFIYFQF